MLVEYVAVSVGVGGSFCVLRQPLFRKNPSFGEKTFIVRKIPMALVGKPIVGKLFRKTHCLFKKTYLEEPTMLLGKTF